MSVPCSEEASSAALAVDATATCEDNINSGRRREMIRSEGNRALGNTTCEEEHQITETEQRRNERPRKSDDREREREREADNRQEGKRGETENEENGERGR